MNVEIGRRKVGAMHRAVVLGVSFVLFTIQPTLGGATVVEADFSHTAVTVAPPIASFYDYTQATTAAWSDSADFDAGTYADTNSTEAADSITLDRIGPAAVVAPTGVGWWDTDWSNRRCFSIDHTAVAAITVDQYQLRLPFPIEQLVADGFVQGDLGDLRAIGADESTSLPLWQDDTAIDTIWVQMDNIAAGGVEDLCIYYGYSAGVAASPANHSAESIFTYTTPKEIYYTVSDTFDSPGSPVNVVTFVDNNDVARSDGTTVNLVATGDLATFDATDNNSGTTFSVLGPISAGTSTDGTDTLIPISFAGTSFVAPLSRDAQRFSFVAPFGDATVDLYDGATLVATFTVTTGSPYTHTLDDITPPNAAIIESDVPVLVSHTSDVDGDSLPLYPAAAGDFYGVRSTEIVIGYGTDSTQVNTEASDGTTLPAPGNRGETTAMTGGAAQGGAAGDAVQLSADQPVGVVSSEDGDGNESTVVLPATELGSQYWAPVDLQYLAFSCPTETSTPVALTVTPPVGPARPVSCTGGPDVAWASDTADLAVTPTRGISITADGGAVFAAYFEALATDDQTGLLGLKQGRQYTWPEPIVTPGTDEGIFQTSGTWESETIDIGLGSQIYGLVDMVGDVPTDTTLRLQIATAATGTPTAFVGPDGTATSFFTVSSQPAVADFQHDGQRLLRVRVEFETATPDTATPRLDSIGVDHSLASLSRSLSGTPTISVSTSIAPEDTTSYLLRVTTTSPAIAGSEATGVYRDATNLANLATETLRFVNVGLGVDSVQQSQTLPTDPAIAFDDGRPHSVALDHSATGAGVTTITFAWQLDHESGGSIFSETDFAVEVTAP